MPQVCAEKIVVCVGVASWPFRSSNSMNTSTVLVTWLQGVRRTLELRVRSVRCSLESQIEWQFFERKSDMIFMNCYGMM